MPRDKLKSLIDTFFCSVDIDKFYSQNQKEKLANWLRENGVIVPPCKVGDTLHLVQVDFRGNYFTTSVVVGSKITMLSILRAYEEKTVVYMSTDREEAEKALAERSVSDAAQ